ncbi:hypothetical protein SHIRM173S_02206 [Streptomyces hirsutus]
MRGDDSAEPAVVHHEDRQEDPGGAEALQNGVQQLVRCGERASGQRGREVAYPQRRPPLGRQAGQSAQLYDAAGVTLEVEQRQHRVPRLRDHLGKEAVHGQPVGAGDHRSGHRLPDPYAPQGCDQLGPPAFGRRGARHEQADDDQPQSRRQSPRERQPAQDGKRHADDLAAALLPATCSAIPRTPPQQGLRQPASVQGRGGQQVEDAQQQVRATEPAQYGDRDPPARRRRDRGRRADADGAEQQAGERPADGDQEGRPWCRRLVHPSDPAQRPQGHVLHGYPRFLRAVSACAALGARPDSPAAARLRPLRRPRTPPAPGRARTRAVSGPPGRTRGAT